MISFKSIVERKLYALLRPTFLALPSQWFNCRSVNSKSFNLDSDSEAANSTPDSFKARNQRRKKGAQDKTKGKPGFWNVVAYATAEEYDLHRLKNALISQDLYIPCELASDDALKSGVGSALHAVAKYKVTYENRHLYYFKEGSVVMWNFPELERRAILRFLKTFEDQSYETSKIQDELEVMSYTYAHCLKQSHIHDSNMYISCQDKDIEDISLDRYTFSNAIALSVKLGMLEALLEQYIRGVEYVTEDLKYGRKVRINQEEVLRKSGELLALRHSINLSSDLLDTPDFYWDKENLEILYQSACGYFSISRRTKVMNEKLNHCVELIELVTTYLSDKHHVRLEWMIIILIMVEVGIEVIDIIFFH